jgi:uncharacterized protein (DUF427 family)
MDEKQKPAGPAPGFRKSPGHRVGVEPVPQRVQVTLGDAVIADSTNALRMRETNHDPVYYFPRADIRMDRLVRTDHTSF